MPAAKTEPKATDPEKIVRVDEAVPGIQRLRRGKGFAYRCPDGHWLRARDPVDRQHLERIRSLAVPPAYESVWICPWPQGHLQATGLDARGRKQYRYHPSWRNEREKAKFDRLTAFGRALPRLRQAVARDLAEGAAAAEGQPRALLLSAMVHLLDTTCIRIGTQAYARENNSYGLTTLRNRHAKVRGHTVTFRFRGKSGVWHEVALRDPHVARIVRCCQDLPGADLFQYVDEEGQCHGVGPVEVNEHIRSLTGGDHTAKDFRTWHASVHAWSLLAPRACNPDWSRSRRMRAHEVALALEEVACRLGNTAAVCRKSYVHPTVLECALEGLWPDATPRRHGDPASPKSTPGVAGLSPEEEGFLRFLQAANRRQRRR
jgi:DNA topoisomerase-1